MKGDRKKEMRGEAILSSLTETVSNSGLAFTILISALPAPSKT